MKVFFALLCFTFSMQLLAEDGGVAAFNQYKACIKSEVNKAKAQDKEFMFKKVCLDKQAKLKQELAADEYKRSLQAIERMAKYMMER